MTGIMGPSIALAGTVRRVPAVVFYDTEFAEQTNWFVYPLAHSVCTPDCYQGKVRGTHVHVRRVPRARVPAPEPLPARSRPAGRLRRRGRASRTRSCGSCRGRPSTTSARRGLTGEQKREPRRDAAAPRAGADLLRGARCRADLARLEVDGPVEDIHHLLAYAQLVVGESATMSSEAAVLGVPGGDDRDDRSRLHRRRGTALRIGPAFHRGPVRHGRVATIEKLLADTATRARAARARTTARRTRSTSRSGWSTTSSRRSGSRTVRASADVRDRRHVRIR